MEPYEHVKQRIADSFSANGLEQEVAQDLAFHITDWKEELHDLLRLYEEVDTLRESQIRKIVIRFLAHVPNHVAAAKKLAGLGPIEDVFKVGVFDEDN
jgi:hypothetical protein